MGFKKSEPVEEIEVRESALAAFVDRQKENVRHWAAPKVEQALAWGEYGLADGTYRGRIAAAEGRKYAQEAADVYGPQVKAGAEKAAAAAGEQYKKYAPLVQEQAAKVAPAVAGAGAVLAPAVAGGLDSLQQFLADLQGEAAATGKQAKKSAKKGSKQMSKKAAKAQKTAAKKLKGAEKSALKTGKKAQKQALKRGKAAKKNAVQGLEVGGKELSALLAAGLAAAQSGAQKGSKELQKGYAKLSPEVQKRLHEAADYGKARRDEYVPAAAAKLAAAADKAGKSVHSYKVPANVEQVLINATGDKKIVAKLRKAAEGAADSTRKSANKYAKPAQRKRRGTGWIVSGMAVAAGAAAFAVWKLTKPVEDPWKAPTPGPVTANVPVVAADGTTVPAAQALAAQAHGSTDPYAKQNAVIAEAAARRNAQA